MSSISSSSSLSSNSSSTSSKSSVSSSKSSESSVSSVSSSSSHSSGSSKSSSSKSSHPKPNRQGPDEPLTYIIPGGYTLTLDYPAPNVEFEGTPDFSEAYRQCFNPKYVKCAYTLDEIISTIYRYRKMDPSLFDYCVFVYLRALIKEIRFLGGTTISLTESTGGGSDYVEWFGRILENRIRTISSGNISTLSSFVELRWLAPWWSESSLSSCAAVPSSSSSSSRSSSL